MQMRSLLFWDIMQRILVVFLMFSDNLSVPSTKVKTA